MRFGEGMGSDLYLRRRVVLIGSILHVESSATGEVRGDARQRLKRPTHLGFLKHGVLIAGRAGRVDV